MNIKTFILTLGMAITLGGSSLYAMKPALQEMKAAAIIIATRPLNKVMTPALENAGLLKVAEEGLVAVDNLYQENFLNVATVIDILDAARSLWKPRAIWMLEKIVYCAPQWTLPYIEHVIGACHSRGKALVKLVKEQGEKGRSISSLLNAVYYAMPDQEPLRHYLKNNETTINDTIKQQRPRLPVLLAGIRAMREAHAQEEHAEITA